jgi:hypothetical protein
VSDFKTTTRTLGSIDASDSAEMFVEQLAGHRDARPKAGRQLSGSEFVRTAAPRLVPKAAQGTFDELLAGVEPDLAAIARRLRAIIRAVDYVVLCGMYAAPTTSISEFPGIHASAKHDRGGAPYFVPCQ